MPLECAHQYILCEWFRLQENEVTSVLTQAVPLECIYRDLLYLRGHTFRLHLQDYELSSVITQTVPLEYTHQELSFEF